MKESWCINLLLKMLLICLLLLSTCNFVMSSDGDRSPFYNKCLKNCNNANCTKENQFKSHAAGTQDIWSKMLFWTCEDECRYTCMWRTVQGFDERGFNTPKFHGKWPFRKIMGVQEPASTFASLLNLAIHGYMYHEISVQFSIKKTPIVLFWHIFAIVCMNAWLWSTIFHSRDSYFTEFMDYTCALSMVMMLFIAAVLRVFHKRRKLSAVVLLATIVYFIEHVRYLYSGRIDYDYNMLVNIVFGVVGSVIWLIWAGVQYISGRRECWKIMAFTMLSGAALTLELLDFPPVYGWDAHALWHLATVPLPLLFYRFVIDDLKYLISPSEKSSLKLT